MKQLSIVLFLLLSTCLISQSKDYAANPKVEKQMNVLGLLGGTSWHSTMEYYSYINQEVNTFFGDNTNPPLLVYTMNQSLIHKHQKADDWQAISEILIEGGMRLERAGAEKIMFCANTPHKVYEEVKSALNIPIIHIADVTAQAIKNQGVKTVLFLGTKYTMTQDFITNRLTTQGIEVYVPEDETVITELHRIIMEELTYGVIEKQSKEYVLNLIESYTLKAIEGVVLGCTEFPLMIEKEDVEIKLFNTTKIHAQSGTDFILQDFIPGDE